MNIFCLRCCFSLFYSGQMFGCVILQNSSLPFWSVSDLSVLKAASIALYSIINWTGMNSSSIMHCTGALVTNQWIPNFKNHQLLVQQKPKRVLGREMRACSCPAVWRLSLRIIKCSASDRTFPKVLVYVLVVSLTTILLSHGVHLAFIRSKQYSYNHSQTIIYIHYHTPCPPGRIQSST